jgi:hypothetical protein
MGVVIEASAVFNGLDAYFSRCALYGASFFLTRLPSVVRPSDVVVPFLSKHLEVFQRLALRFFAQTISAGSDVIDSDFLKLSIDLLDFAWRRFTLSSALRTRRSSKDRKALGALLGFDGV